MASLKSFDLVTTFVCAVELGTAVAAYLPPDAAPLKAKRGRKRRNHEAIESDATLSGSDIEESIRQHQLLDDIEDAANRLKRALGASGALGTRDLWPVLRKGKHIPDAPGEWEDWHTEFRNLVHPHNPQIIRRAVRKLARAAACLSGYAGHGVQDPVLREKGLELLGWGVAQLWEGMNPTERSGAKPMLGQAHQAIAWPSSPRRTPGKYKGPDEIPVDYLAGKSINFQFFMAEPGHGLANAEQDQANKMEYEKRMASPGWQRRVEVVDGALRAVFDEGNPKDGPPPNPLPPFPKPPGELIESAMRAVPPVFTEDVHAESYGVPVAALIQSLCAGRQHSVAAAAWAVHQFCEDGALVAERAGSAPTWKEFYGCYFVRPTPQLWEWWRKPAVSASSSPPPEKTVVPNERTEQPIIDALFNMGAIGLEGLKAISRDKRPTGERLAPRAIGRGCDGQFKATLAHMVDLGWLDNGRNHGIVSGYFLTDLGLKHVSKCARSQD